MSSYHDRHDDLLNDPYPDDSFGYGMQRMDEDARKAAYDPGRELYLSGGLNPGRGWQPPLGEPSRSPEQRAADKLAQILAGECFRCGGPLSMDTYVCDGCGKPANPESFQPKEAA